VTQRTKTLGPCPATPAHAQSGNVPKWVSKPAAKKNGAPAKKLRMVIYLTAGRALAASDWWITQCRFHFITAAGKAESRGRSIFRKTIEENEKQGLTFILNFTPSSALPLNP
jgi:hypothetical protein